MDLTPRPVRTVCHGCRAVAHELVTIESEQRYRPVVVPGDGTLMRETSPGIMVSEPCPICGDTDTPGWVPGFVPPV
jgi:hypothetical protein